VAFKDEVEAYRYFILSNIKEIKILTEIFIRDENFSLNEYARRSFGVYQEEQYSVKWRVAPPYAAEAKKYLFHPSQKFEEQTDGGLIISFMAGALLEMCFHLAAWEGAIEILEPEALKMEMRGLINNLKRTVGEK
jgi:predicted DNA-binding transcriptional regulator YafY